MSQISAPFRFALIGMLVLGAVWFVALRPKSPDAAPATPPAAPGVQGLTSDMQKARDAVETANAAAAKSQATGTAGDTASTKVAKKTTVTATKTASGAKVVTKKSTTVTAAGDPAAPIVRALDHGKVAILFFRNRSSDSGAVADTVRRLRSKNVVVRVASIVDVGKYEVFTRDTPVNQAPTALIIGPTKRAKVIVGFTSAAELKQAIGDVRPVKKRK